MCALHTYTSMTLMVLTAMIMIAPCMGKKSNIIFLLTDDQDLRLGSMQAMPSARQHLLAGGANISNFFISTPICCPSRAALLAGRYEHNNKCDGPSFAGCMRQNTSKETNPLWWGNGFIPKLHSSGYTTGLFGKVLNVMKTYGCDNSGLPEGVDRLYIMCAASYYETPFADFGPSSLSNNSVYRTGTGPEEYSTALVGNKTIDWIKAVLASGADHPPFFAYLGPHAPHLPSTPAPWYLDHPIGNTPVPKQVYYDYAPVGKHAFGAPYVTLDQLEPQITNKAAAAIALEHGNRLKSLLSVDDIVAALYDTLTAAGEWDNTYMFYTSDHGYSLGEFRIDSHKTQVWDHNTRVPMMIKGPGITPGLVFQPMASMVDLGPTILDLATGEPNGDSPAEMDGLSFAPALLGQPQHQWKDAVLVEYQSIRGKVTVTADDARSPEYISAYGYHVDASGSRIEPEKFSAHDGPNNTFSAIRIINTTATPPVNLLYAEFTDVSDPAAWNFAPESINFYELYNVTSDYFMLNNIYPSASQPLREYLHTRLQAAIKCRGRAQCYSCLSDGQEHAV
eukprot:m.657476 g.657476  ORF g.657476 m.657476 type:complete len:563 (-) comp22713_c0_seq8:2129-3817(-)